MKKVILIVILLVVLMISGCKSQIPDVQPKQVSNIKEFTEIYRGENFVLYKRTEIDPDQAYILPAYSVGKGKDECLIGSYEIIHYLVEFEDEYYDLIDGYELGLYEPKQMIDMGVEGANCDWSE